MELRPYQAECIETIEAQPPGAFLAQMATGLGKTVTFANIPRHGERMLILSHREELVEQPRKYFNCSYGIERAQQHSHGEEVVSASIQTLVRRLDISTRRTSVSLSATRPITQLPAHTGRSLITSGRRS